MQKVIRQNVVWIAGVFALGVMLFGCWPAAAAVIIVGETATGSVLVPDDGSGRFPSNAVNNSGITINTPDLATDGQITHGDSYPTMWTAGHNYNLDFVPNGALGAQLLIDLNGIYDLDGMRIWNYNGVGGVDAGIHSYNLETSPDGSGWTLRQSGQMLAQAPGAPGYTGVYAAVSWTGVRFVRLTIADTYRAFDDVGGLSEIMFSAVVPEPSAILLLGIGGLLMQRWRRKA